VTHVLGVRAFSTQLLCEQVIGRALRRQSYDLNEDGLLNVEYADVLGVPFDFTAKPVVAPPQPPRETVQVRAMRPERDALEIRFPRVVGYRVELPEERLEARFTEDSTLMLTPDLVGPTITRNAGIIGEAVDLNLKHLGDTRTSTLLFHLTKRLLLTKWRDAGEEPKLHLFGQLKRITREWLETHLVCQGGTYPAQLLYQELADMACERITAAITARFAGERPIQAVLDPYNPVGSTAHVRFNTSRRSRWQTDPARCHVNWVVLDSDWEAELCRVAEAHPRVRAYVKNHNLGLEVPYRHGSVVRRYLPDFIVVVDDGHGDDDLLHLVVEIKGYRREDAREKKATMDAYWVPAVNHLGTLGRWAFAELTEVYRIESDFEARVKASFDRMIAAATRQWAYTSTHEKVRAHDYVVRQFGATGNAGNVALAIWDVIGAASDRAFHLSDIDRVAVQASCEAEDILPVLSALSRHSGPFLRMELQSDSDVDPVVSTEELFRRLTEWWRRRTISDREWQQWASRVRVKWVPVHEGDTRP
jgi:type III restriction enzyme